MPEEHARKLHQQLLLSFKKFFLLSKKSKATNKLPHCKFQISLNDKKATADGLGLSSSLKSHWERDSPRYLLRMPTPHADHAIFKAVLHPSLDEVLWHLFFSCNNCPVSCSMPRLSTEDEGRVPIGSQADKQRKSDSGVLTYVLIIWGWFLSQCSKESEHKGKQRVWPQKSPTVWLLFSFH